MVYWVRIEKAVYLNLLFLTLEQVRGCNEIKEWRSPRKLSAGELAERLTRMFLIHIAGVSGKQTWGEMK